jgi:PAS domain S-box-containing protein
MELSVRIFQSAGNTHFAMDNPTSASTPLQASTPAQTTFLEGAENSPVLFAFEHDELLRYTRIDLPAQGFAAGIIVGRTDTEIFRGEAGRILSALKQAALSGGVELRVRMELALNGPPATYDICLTPLKDGLGNPAGLKGWLAAVPLSGGSGTAASDGGKRAGQDPDESDERVRLLAMEKMRLDQEVRAERELLQTIFDTIPVMLTRYRPDIQVLQVNPEFERVTGWTAVEAQQIDLMAACYPDPAYREEVRQFMDSASGGWKDVQMTTRDGRMVETIWANVKLSGDSKVGIGLDISARKQAEEALRLARDTSDRTGVRIARLQKVTAELTSSLTPAEVVQVILKDGLMALNATAMSVKLLTDDGLWLENIEAFGVKPQLSPAYRRYPLTAATPLAEAVRTGEPSWWPSREALIKRYPNLAQEFSEQGFESSCALPLVMGQRIAGGIGVNFRRVVDFNAEEREFILTLARYCSQALERARLYEVEQRARLELEERVAERTRELRELAGHLETSREEERASVARELHDDLGQILAVTKMDVAQLAKRIAQDPERARLPVADVVEQLRTIQGAMDEGVRSIRALVANLRPQILDDLGLTAAIEWQVQQFEERTGIDTRFSSDVVGLDWEREREMALFRILQESLTNVARHARATRVEVELRDEAEKVALEVRDNGRGIGDGDLAKMNHFGILGMRERAILLGGGIVIEGGSGSGTRVCVRVPR